MVFFFVIDYVTDWLELTAEVEDRVRLYVTSGSDIIFAED